MTFEDIALGYAAIALFTAFFIALIDDNKSVGIDMFRIAIWPVFWATGFGQVVRAFVRAVLP